MDEERLNAIAAKVAHPTNGVTVKTRRYLLKSYHDVFVGSELVTFIAKSESCARPAAHALATQLHRRGYFKHCVDAAKPLLDGNYFYFFTDKAMKAADKVEVTRRSVSTLRDILELLMDPSSGITVKDRKWRLKTYKQCFVASEMVDWFMRQSCFPFRSRTQALELGQRLHSAGLIEHVVDPQPFADAYLFFKFTKHAAEVMRGEAEVAEDVVEAKEVDVDSFDVISVLGEGGYGRVLQVRKKDSGRIYAMKVIEKVKITSDKAMEHLLTEKRVLLNDNAFLLHLHFSFASAQKLYLVTDFLQGGDLFFHLSKQPSGFKEKVARFMIAELVLAIEHLHHCGIIYRDLKLENVLLDNEGHICLADFGLSKVLDESNATQTFCGSQGYLAPEILKGEQYSFEVDWFSLGVMMYELISGNVDERGRQVDEAYGAQNPFLGSDFQQTCRNILRKQVVYPSSIFSRQAQELLRGLLARSPETRLKSAPEIKRQAWFKGLDWQKLAVKKLLPPFRIHVRNETDVSNFDKDFTTMTFDPSDSFDASTATTSEGSPPRGEFDDFQYVQADLSLSSSRGHAE